MWRGSCGTSVFFLTQHSVLSTHHYEPLTHTSHEKKVNRKSLAGRKLALIL